MEEWMGEWMEGKAVCGSVEGRPLSESAGPRATGAHVVLVQCPCLARPPSLCPDPQTQGLLVRSCHLRPRPSPSQPGASSSAPERAGFT